MKIPLAVTVATFAALWLSRDKETPREKERRELPVGTAAPIPPPEALPTPYKVIVDSADLFTLPGGGTRKASLSNETRLLIVRSEGEYTHVYVPANNVLREPVEGWISSRFIAPVQKPIVIADVLPDPGA